MATVTLIAVNDVVYELGIRSLTAYLRHRGHAVRLVFINEDEGSLTDRNLEPLLQVVDGSDLIGLSLLSHSHGKAVRVTSFLRSRIPAEVPIIWGGIHATGFPDQCLRDADLVCLGEGEETLADIADRMDAGDSYESVDNVCYKAPDGSVRRNPVRPPIQDLDSLPFQDYSLLDEYVLEDGELVVMDADQLEKHLLHYPFPGMGHVYVTMTSRGCPFNCSFCCNDVWHTLYGSASKVRKRSIAHVAQELEQVVQRFPFLRMILLEDDSFLVRAESEIREFATAVRDRVGLPFGIEMNPNEVSYDKLAALKEGGLGLVHVGIQSGDDAIRRTYYRRFTSEAKIMETNRVLSSLGILHKYDIIIDTPFPGDAEASLRLLRRFKGRFSINLYSLRVYPGLAIERIMREAGFDDWLAANDNSVSYNAISSSEAYAFALKRYIPFPPSARSMLVARACALMPKTMYRFYKYFGGRQLFALYRRVRLWDLNRRAGRS